MTKRVDDKSKRPADWSIGKLLDEVDAGNKAAIEFTDRQQKTPKFKNAVKRINDFIQRSRSDRDDLIERVVPGYKALAGRQKQKAEYLFCVKLAQAYNYKPTDLLAETTPDWIAAMVDDVLIDEVDRLLAAGDVPTKTQVTDTPAGKEEWIGPISKSEMARRLLMRTSAKWDHVSHWFPEKSVKQESRQLWSFDISALTDLQQKRARPKE